MWQDESVCAAGGLHPCRSSDLPFMQAFLSTCSACQPQSASATRFQARVELIRSLAAACGALAAEVHFAVLSVDSLTWLPWPLVGPVKLMWVSSDYLSIWSVQTEERW